MMLSKMNEGGDKDVDEEDEDDTDEDKIKVICKLAVNIQSLMFLSKVSDYFASYH